MTGSGQATILWRRLDLAGHDAARLHETRDGWRLEGSAVFLAGCGACRLDYAVACDASWRTSAAQVSGWLGPTAVALDIRVDSRRQWTVNGRTVAEVAGCDDIDLSFTPATNLLPVRRLRLAVGAREPVRTAWLRTPELTVEALDQVYERLTASWFRYESSGGTFTTELEVRPDGFVTRYGDLWVVETPA